MRKGIRGWLALLLAALLMLPMAALADTTIEAPEAIEPPVAEYTSLELSGADDAGEETCETIAPDMLTITAEDDTAESEDDWEIAKTRQVDGETWSNVNVTRAAGFNGKLAVVSRILKLSNVTLEGIPAQNVRLQEWFDLKPGAGIVCVQNTGLALSANLVAIDKGFTVTLAATENGKAVKASKVKWSTSNKSIASVSSKGVVKGRKKGEAVITAKHGTATATCSVVVTQTVYPKKIKLSKTSLKLGLFATSQLTYTVTPANADVSGLTWKSSNTNVVTVDGSGKLQAVGGGKAKITLTAPNKTHASCTVRVTEIKPTALQFKARGVKMDVTDEFAIEYTLTPADASNRKVTFKSSNEAVATVTADGLVTAIAPGTAIITGTSAANAALKDTCNVTVNGAKPKPGEGRLAGLIIGINPGHQIKTIKESYPIAPGSSKKAKGVKTGASGKSTHQNEYEVVLQIGLKLKRILEENGATVVITRTTNDVMLTNIDRAEMLNAAGCDVALQLHNNSCSNSSKTGVSGYIRTTGDWVEESRRCAECLCAGMAACTPFKNLGVKIENEFMSLNWTTTPSVLLEMGYLSNRSDDKLLALDETREQLAQGIFMGLCEYFGR